MLRRLILASASPARLRLLEGAGLRPEVIVSHVEEGGVGHEPPAMGVGILARRKAEAVAAHLAVAPRTGDSDRGGPLVLGCDSLLEVDGTAFGKTASPEEAARRWRRMRGRTGLLHTGHCLIEGDTGRAAVAVDTATVTFGRPTDREIDAYAATPEALEVAGPFTLEGMAAPWIESISGNYGTVLGISLPTVRRLLRDFGVEIVDLWAEPGPAR